MYLYFVLGPVYCVYSVLHSTIRNEHGILFRGPGTAQTMRRTNIYKIVRPWSQTNLTRGHLPSTRASMPPPNGAASHSKRRLPSPPPPLHERQHSTHTLRFLLRIQETKNLPKTCLPKSTTSPARFSSHRFSPALDISIPSSIAWAEQRAVQADFTHCGQRTGE